MRPVQSTGRPGTTVIPATWSAAPRVVIAGTRTVNVTIRHPGGTKGAFNPDTGTYPTVPFAPHYSDTARVQVLNSEDLIKLVAEQQVTTMGYLVVVDLSADQVQPDDVLTITGTGDDNADPTLTGREMVVRSVMRGSLAWERDLVCTEDQG